MLFSSPALSVYSPITLTTSFLENTHLFNADLSYSLTPMQVQELIFYYEHDYVKLSTQRKWHTPPNFFFSSRLMKVEKEEAPSLFFVVPCVPVKGDETHSNIAKTLLTTLFDLFNKFNKHQLMLPREIQMLLLIHHDNIHWGALNCHFEINPSIAKEVEEKRHLNDWPGLYAKINFYYTDSLEEGLSKRQRSIQRALSYFVSNFAANCDMPEVSRQVGSTSAEHALVNGFLKATRGSYLYALDSALLRAWTSQIINPKTIEKKSQPPPLIFSKAGEPFAFIKDFEQTYKSAFFCRISSEVHAILDLGNNIFFQVLPVAYMSKGRGDHLSGILINWLLETLAYWLMASMEIFPRELRTCILLYHPQERQWSALNACFEMAQTCQDEYTYFKADFVGEELICLPLIKQTVDIIKAHQTSQQRFYPGPGYFPLPFSRISFTHFCGSELLKENVREGLNKFNECSNSFFYEKDVEPLSDVFIRPPWYTVASLSLTKACAGISLSAVEEISNRLGSLSLSPHSASM